MSKENGFPQHCMAGPSQCLEPEVIHLVQKWQSASRGGHSAQEQQALPDIGLFVYHTKKYKAHE
jgi:hypothetical protein